MDITITVLNHSVSYPHFVAGFYIASYFNILYVLFYSVFFHSHDIYVMRSDRVKAMASRVGLGTPQEYSEEEEREREKEEES